jgi:hypothetical protein
MGVIIPRRLAGTGWEPFEITAAGSGFPGTAVSPDVPANLTAADFFADPDSVDDKVLSLRQGPPQLAARSIGCCSRGRAAHLVCT